MKLGIDLKIDYAFKRSFGAQERIDNLRSLLEHTLRDRIVGPLTDLTILNPIQNPETESGKLSVLDILATDRSGTQYHIEMQMIGYNYLPKRFLYYNARTYWAQLRGGENFADLAPAISIIILNDVLFSSLPGFRNVFQMRETSLGQVFCEDMEIHLIELPKFEKQLKDLIDGFDQWLYLFRNASNLDPQSPPLELTLPAVKRVLKELQIMSQTEQERILYDAREKAIRDEVSRNSWYERQRKEGRQEGRQEERVLAQRKIELIEQINRSETELGRPISAIGKLFDLPEETLQRILDDMAKK
jgi:predicted transposase/invertase (TIGR01784 family)